VHKAKISIYVDLVSVEWPSIHLLKSIVNSYICNTHGNDGHIPGYIIKENILLAT